MPFKETPATGGCARPEDPCTWQLSSFLLLCILLFLFFVKYYPPVSFWASVFTLRPVPCLSLLFVSSVVGEVVPPLTTLAAASELFELYFLRAGRGCFIQ